jgi:hypothetical protein
MWFVFADDSEEKAPRRSGLGHLVGVGAVLFPEDSVLKYTEGMRSLRKELGIPSDVELKWSPPTGSWLKTDEGNAVRTPLRKRMLTLACDLRARSLSVVWDRGSLEWPIPATRREVLKYLYDKVSLCLATLDDHGIVIADEPGGGPADQKAWLAETLPLTDEGTDYTKPERIVLPITTAPSHHIPHLQLADLVAGATTAAIAGNRFALELKPELMTLAHRSFYGCVGGAGLTLWPPELRNLFHWICDDDVYIRNGIGAQLPLAGLPYADSDGLPKAN